MKKWENAEVLELDINKTSETKCFCENGLDEEMSTYSNGGHRPGHEHKPHRPGKPCPSDPVPDPTPDPS